MRPHFSRIGIVVLDFLFWIGLLLLVKHTIR